MKKINYFFIFLFTLLVSCYEDKGNYDYKDIQDIEIEDFSYINKTIGDTIRVEPKFNIDIPEDASYLSFKWRVGGETRPDDPNWNNRNFYWIADKLVDGDIILEITDTRYNVKYMQRADCIISGEFNAWFSWTILSEKNGEACLSFFKSEETEWSADYSEVTISEWKEYNDLYSSRNGGEKLGRGALSMREHYCTDANSNVGQYWIFTEEGAKDLEGAGFTKDIDLNQTFMGEGIPAGVIMQGGVFMVFADILYDQNGHLYSRVKADPELFNSDYFLSDPVKYNGKVLESCEPVFGRYSQDDGNYVPIIDRKDNRVLAFTDGWRYAWNQDVLTGAAHVLEVPRPTFASGEKLPENYIPLDDFEGYELLHMCFKKVTTSGLPGYYALFKNASGRFYLEEFALRSYYDEIQGPYLKLSNIKVYDLGGKLTQDPSLMCVPPNTTTDYVFFAVGNVLYMYDKDTQIWSEYFRFDSPITAMDGDNHFKNLLLAVGLENGEFHVLNIVGAKNRPLEKRIICTSKSRFGKIIQINWKIGNSGSWT